MQLAMDRNTSMWVRTKGAHGCCTYQDGSTASPQFGDSEQPEFIDLENGSSGKGDRSPDRLPSVCSRV
jgi:hypothetical protein